MSYRNNTVISIEDNRQSVDEAKITAIGTARIGFDIVAVVGIGARKLGEGKIVFRDRRAQHLQIAQQGSMGQQLSALEYVPLPISLGQDTGEVVPFEYQKASPRKSPTTKFTNQDGIAATEDVETVGFVVAPLSIDILAVRQIGQGGSLQFILVPVGNVEGQFVVHQDAQSVPLFLRSHRTLVLAVTVVKYLAMHVYKSHNGYRTICSRIDGNKANTN
jgi:hypothetical protein